MRRERKYHYIYKTTCNVTGRWYIGMHSTDDLDDGYIGSGKRLWFSINHHGKENHTKEILEFCENRVELKKREAEIVNSDLIQEINCMNLKTGGEGGFSNEEHRRKFIEAVNYEASHERIKWLRENDPNWSQLLSDKIKISHKNIDFNHATFEGRIHSDKTKKLISLSKKDTGKGETNSQYGTCWITRDGLNKKVKKEDLETYLNEGWLKGRK